MTPFPIPECVAALSAQEICIMADDPQTDPVEPVDPAADDPTRSGGHAPTPPKKPD